MYLPSFSSSERSQFSKVLPQLRCLLLLKRDGLMPFVTTLIEAGELNGVSTRLERLAELHPLSQKRSW